MSDAVQPAEPVPPPADDKDWTWVLERACPECGYDASAIAGADIPARVRGAVAAMQAALQAPGAAERPAPEVWSSVEYAAHLRDVCIVFGTRLAAMRGTHDPMFPNWDQDETARTERYWELAPATVAAELGVEGERLAADFDTVRTEEWQRPGRRSNGSVFTVDTLGRYLLHDLEHHVHDVHHVRDVSGANEVGADDSEG